MENKTNNKSYFPLFYKYVSYFAAMSMEEIGTIIYAILVSGGCLPPREELDSKLGVIYTFMVDEANRLFNKNLPNYKHSDRSYISAGVPKIARRAEAAPTHERYGNFDPNEAFQDALRRSYPEGVLKP